MKILSYITLLIGIMSCAEQGDKSETPYLSISPIIQQSKNSHLISVLEKFLLTKNNSPNENEYWLDSDFEKFSYPYRDIYQIEKSKFGDNHYKPTLMELIDLEGDEKLLKIGFVGVHPETYEIVIKCIFNIIAVKMEGKWKFKRAIEFLTKNWQVLNKESIKYYLPPNKIPNDIEITKQQHDIWELCRFFETEPVQITYYSCNTPKELFELKGFDYTPNMYYSTTGGMIDYGNVVYSGNNSEIYTHEIVHIYTGELYPNINKLLDEGIATYIGGSGKTSYAEHRNSLKEYLTTNDLNLSEHTDPYERLYIEGETPIPYIIGALICERTIRIYGKEKLFEIFSSDADIWTSLKSVNLTKGNLTEELEKELKLPPTMYMP